MQNLIDILNCFDFTYNETHQLLHDVILPASCKWRDTQCAMHNFSPLQIYRLYNIGAYLDVCLCSAEYLELSTVTAL